MRYLLMYFCLVGVYSAFSQVWQWLEQMELGYTNVTIVDTVICWLLSIFVTLVILICTDN